ncbi:MAG: hypothetical protein ACN6OU_02090 [Stenotrophomonas acidaminiphila]|uniref:hypothetical protein n=1 Tax=Stenotrophomonas acidaminiphila TaxID=128780 RepID=UPI001319DE0A|nr:hypothetical protein [Stenotrophomonas acidaminiphila]
MRRGDFRQVRGGTRGIIVAPCFPHRHDAMARRILIGMLGFLLACLIGAAGYRLGQHLAGHDAGPAQAAA